jgi:hypothetical protein
MSNPERIRGGARKLEMACIGMCLDGGDERQSKLGGCDHDQQACGDYLDCVGNHWATSRAATHAVVGSRETQCTEVCDLGDCFIEMWMGTSTRLDPAELDQQKRQYERFVERACVQGCVEHASDAEIESAEKCNEMSCVERMQCVMSRDFIVI